MLFASAHDAARARGFSTLAAMAVQGSGPFWRRLGFRPVEGFVLSDALAASYGASAEYLWRPVAGD